MEYRQPLGTQRPRPPQRALSSGSHGVLPKRPPLPSRLSNVRSASQPVNVVDLTSEGGQAERSNRVTFMSNKEAVVQSPEVISIDDDEAEPPAKRVKTNGKEFKPVVDGEATGGEDKTHTILPGIPMPAIPRAKSSTSKMGIYRRHRLGNESGARKAQGAEPPAMATRVPPPRNVLDFAPWTGNHPEDLLNETVIKGGYFDKLAGTNQSETNSAKPTVWPSLSQKNHPALSALSWLLVAVMDKRQSIGKSTAPSTFRPPLRLAVQEGKREIWLKDLANPEVSLRKLSKNVPHGIRGKLLMEQCLGKLVPLHRAMWLAKCVGMHELRAFRRKGYSEAAASSGEAKWVREWTVSLEQFLEGVIATCGIPNWQRSMNYAVKLATAFYSEKLLDVDHYLDWIVSSLADSSTERLPIWAILAQLHWKDITRYGRRGRCFARAILEHLHHVTDADLPALAPLKTNLQKMVVVLATANRGCLIIPAVWKKYRRLLSPRTTSREADSPARYVVQRNERLAGPLGKTPDSSRSPLLDLYDVLDATSLDYDIDSLSKKCFECVESPSILVQALLDWASTRYRTGHWRIYLAARIIAVLHHSGHDTDTSVLTHLGGMGTTSADVQDDVHCVIAELTRVGAFLVGKYLQWLITSGVLSGGMDHAGATRLLAALPAADLPAHVANTRMMLMRRLGYDDENAYTADVALKILDSISASNTRDSVSLPELRVHTTRSTRSLIAKALVDKLGEAEEGISISTTNFCAVREVFEVWEDDASLATLVEKSSASNDGALLATVTDTVNMHAASFAAMGQLTEALDRLVEKYLALRPHQTPDRTFVLALAGLARRISGRQMLVKLLTDDLTLFEQQNSLAACSPASDSVIGMHATTLDSDEDINAVFASGNVMDERLMERVFSRIVQRAARASSRNDLSKACMWLNQLRVVETTKSLSTLITRYLRNALSDHSKKSITLPVVAALALSDCTSLGSIADTVKDVQDPELARRLLQIFVSPVSAIKLDRSDSYRFALQQARCQDNHAEALVKLLRTAQNSHDFDPQDDHVVRFVVQYTQAHQHGVENLSPDSSRNHCARRNAESMLGNILSPDHVPVASISGVVDMATPLSIRYCLALNSLWPPDIRSEGEELALATSIIKAFERNCEVWPQLLPLAGHSTKECLREMAQHQLMTVTMDGTGNNHETARQKVSDSLDLLAMTTHKQAESSDTTIIATIAERLHDLARQISSVPEISRDAHTTATNLLYRLEVVLGWTVIAMESPISENDAAQQSRCSLLLALCTLLIHQNLQAYQDMVEYTFDVASALSDKIPESSLLSLRNRLPPDARLNFLLGGSMNSTDSWLALASPVQPPGTQQQRALQRQTSQTQMQPSRAYARVAQSPQTPGQAQRGWPGVPGGKMPTEVKVTPHQLRQWEMIPDSSTTMGENDTSLSLNLFATRKV